MLSSMSERLTRIEKKQEELKKHISENETYRSIEKIQFSNFIEDLRSRVSDLENKYEHIHKSLNHPVQAITDTERLDFLCNHDNNDYRALTILWKYDEFVVIHDRYKGVETGRGKTLRQAIDAAIRGKDGE